MSDRVRRGSLLPRLNFLVAAIFLIAAGPAFGRQRADSTPPSAPQSASSRAPSERTFFPRHWLRGYLDFEYAPTTNEPDLGRCLASTGQFGGARASCADFARYMLSGYVEMQPIGRTPLRHVFVFAAPRFSFGNNVPQFSYTYAFTPIACESLLGIGVELPGNFEFRAVRHSVYWMGRYQNYLGPADLGTTGPYGGYSTVGVRWHFGAIHDSH
jgi:hypothetical protein